MTFCLFVCFKETIQSAPISVTNTIVPADMAPSVVPPVTPIALISVSAPTTTTAIPIAATSGTAMATVAHVEEKAETAASDWDGLDDISPDDFSAELSDFPIPYSYDIDNCN